MTVTGDEFTIQLKETHLGCGNYRYTNTRDIIYNEMYVKNFSKFYDKLSHL